jgi:hypothetical protein
MDRGPACEVASGCMSDESSVLVVSEHTYATEATASVHVEDCDACRDFQYRDDHILVVLWDPG